MQINSINKKNPVIAGSFQNNYEKNFPGSPQTFLFENSNKIPKKLINFNKNL